MELSKLKHFLESRGWTTGQHGRRFIDYIPPRLLNLPAEFRLELPIQQASGKGMEIYSESVSQALKEIYTQYKDEDLTVLLNTNNTIYCTRIIDSDTVDGTIPL